MSELVESILRFLENFSVKRLFLLICVLLFLGCVAFFYERYTAAFSLSRLERIARLAKQLEDSSPAQDSKKKLEEIQHTVVEQLRALVIEGENKHVATVVTFEIPRNVWLWKLIAGGAPWLLMSLAVLLSAKQNPNATFLSFLGLLMLVGFFAGIGAWLPTIAWPWFNLLVYPGLSLLIVVLPAVIPKILHYKEIRESSLRKAILNNLRMISAASDQYFLENGVAEVRLEQIVGPGKFIKSLIPVNGESYDGMIIRQGQAISVTTKERVVITYNP